MKYDYLNSDILEKKGPMLYGGMIENYTNGGMVRESRLMIFRLLSMLFYVKWTPRIRSSTYFYHQTKLT